LERTFDDGALPVVADANSLTYVLHTPVGGDFAIDDNGRPLRLRVVGALKDSVLQGEFIMAESAFLRTFPAQQGYGLPADRGARAQVAGGRARDRERARGLRRRCARERRNGWTNTHRVGEHVSLHLPDARRAGALLLGTVGVAAVLLRNVLERRPRAGAAGVRWASDAAISWRWRFVESATLVAAGLVAGGVTRGWRGAGARRRGVRAPIGAGACCSLRLCWSSASCRLAGRARHAQDPAARIAAVGVITHAHVRDSRSLRCRVLALVIAGRRLAPLPRRRRVVAELARSAAERHQRRDRPAAALVRHRERHLEGAHARTVGLHAHRLGRPRLRQRGRGPNLALWALDRAKGTVRWKRPLGAGNRRMMKQQMSSPSPVTDGRMVWVMTGTGLLKAFDSGRHREVVAATSRRSTAGLACSGATPRRRSC
jgi:hypothetical protein